MAFTAKQKSMFARDLNRGIALSLGTFEEALMTKMAEMGTSATAALHIFQAMALTAYNRMRDRTPVKTGFALAGWRIKSERWTKNHIVIDIWNEVNYIIFLEYGWSKKNPLGMMRITLEEMSHRISTGRALTKGRARRRSSMKTLKVNQGGWKS